MIIPIPDWRARKVRTQQSLIPGSWFATYELAPEKRFEAWRDTISIFLDSSLSSHSNQDDFSGEVEAYLIDDIVFSRARSSGQKFDRRSPKIAFDGIDHYMIQLFFEGHAEMNIHRRTVRNEPGQIMSFDLGDIMDSFNARFDLFNIFIPRARLAPLLLRADSLQGLMPSLDEGSGYLLSGYLQTLYRAIPTLAPTDAPAAVTALLELVAAAFNNAAGKQTESFVSHRSQLTRAQLFIRENLGAADLSVEMIARNSGLSRSALYELFEPIGGVAAYVREMRLRKCLTELASVRYMSASVAEIAFKWGFSDPAVFTRAFRRRFGQTPTETRELARAQAGRERVIIDPVAGNRLHEEWIASLA